MCRMRPALGLRAAMERPSRLGLIRTSAHLALDGIVVDPDFVRSTFVVDCPAYSTLPRTSSTLRPGLQHFGEAKSFESIGGERRRQNRPLVALGRPVRPPFTEIGRSARDEELPRVCATGTRSTSELKVDTPCSRPSEPSSAIRHF